jgi:glycosyltransferase involved in cell wall biosynthesis
MANTLLSFGIPVYNNAAMLDEALSYFYNELQLDDFALYVSDNGSADSAAQVLEKYAGEHENLHYFLQDKNRGTEWNEFFLQEKCETKYFMLLADYARLYKDKFTNLLNMLQNNDYDALVFNDGSRLSYKKSQLYTGPNRFLIDFGWHLTHMTSMILSREVFRQGVPPHISRLGSEFYAEARVFNYLGEKDSCKVYWYDEDCVYFSPQKKASTWFGRFTYVWIEQYVETVLALPIVYKLESKLLCLKSFYEGSLILQLVTFAKYIKQRDITSKQIYKYRKHIAYISKFDWRFLFFLSLLPKPLAQLFYIFTWVLKKCKFAVWGIKNPDRKKRR